MTRIFASLFLLIVAGCFCLSAEQSPNSKVQNGKHSPAAQQLIRLATGVSLEYAESGSSTGIPVILLHGLSDSWHSYASILPKLPPSFHAFALSQRGHGNSDRPQKDYLPSDLATDVAAFLDAKKLNRAIIVGHSMGSYVAQRFAIDYPERTAGLVLVGSFDSLKDNAGADALRKEIAALKDPLDRAWVKSFQVSTCAKPISSEVMENFVDESMKVPARVWKAAFEGLIEGDHSHLLGRIASPTLIIMGEKDDLFPRSVQESLAKKIVNSKLLSYENVGHAVHWEEPERFAADLISFVQQLNQIKN